MLVLSRKLGEKIYIGENICITVVDIDRGKIRLGIEAPRDVPIYRQELLPLKNARAFAPEDGFTPAITAEGARAWFLRLGDTPAASRVLWDGLPSLGWAAVGEAKDGAEVLASLAWWAVLAYPARLVWGPPAIFYTAVALGICLPPAALTLAWGQRALRQAPEQQLLMVVGGTGLRLVVVLGAGLALYLLVPYFQQPGFWVALLVFYLFTLALETGLLLGRSLAGDAQT